MGWSGKSLGNPDRLKGDGSGDKRPADKSSKGCDSKGQKAEGKHLGKGEHCE